MHFVRPSFADPFFLNLIYIFCWCDFYYNIYGEISSKQVRNEFKKGKIKKDREFKRSREQSIQGADER